MDRFFAHVGKAALFWDMDVALDAQGMELIVILHIIVSVHAILSNVLS
jgi:hypothetical protein